MLPNTKRQWSFWAQLVVVLLAIEFAYLAIWRVIVLPMQQLSQKEHYPYSDLGAWLQGILTPVLVTVALITWWSQQRSQREEAAAQQAATRLNATALILTHLHQFYGHLNYMAACALTNSRPRGDTIAQGNFECVNILIDVLRGHSPSGRPVPNQAVLSRDEIIRSEQFQILTRDMRAILDLLQTAEIAYMTDYRITELKTEIDKAENGHCHGNRPWQSG